MILLNKHFSTNEHQALERYVPAHQLVLIQSMLAEDDGNGDAWAYIDFLRDTLQQINKLPKRYQGDSFDDAICYAHYFMGGCDWFLIEAADSDRIAFCYANLGDPQMAEYGSIGLAEFDNIKTWPKPEMDLHWTPRPMHEILTEIHGETVSIKPVATFTRTEIFPQFVEMNDSDDTAESMTLAQFVDEFGEGLLKAVQSENPPIFNGKVKPEWEQTLKSLKRQPFEAQVNAVYAVTQQFETEPAAVIDGEMGSGKTLMGIAAAMLQHKQGNPRTLVIAPPHLVYKWRREIFNTVPSAKVWILNGPDTLRKLLAIRDHHKNVTDPEFYILGRVRMRLGFNWRAAYSKRRIQVGDDVVKQIWEVVACPSCGHVLEQDDRPMSVQLADLVLGDTRTVCVKCKGPLWQNKWPEQGAKSREQMVDDALQQIPTIGKVRARKLLNQFGDSMLSSMLEDNFYNFINLCDEEGEFMFSDRQAKRIERHLANNEISFGQGGYQPTEFIKRQLPSKFFGMLIVDEGHEYKNEGSAQGQAMGVLASQCRKVLLLTGTLMGGYADDLFYLLHRMNPGLMVSDGFAHNERGSLGTAANAFMREHGILVETLKEMTGRSYRTSKATQYAKSISKAPGFSPSGIMRYVVSITAFVKLKDLGKDVLPPYQEQLISLPMADEQRAHYMRMSVILKNELKSALRSGDHSLLGVVLNALLAWPDCCFRAENVMHPHKKNHVLVTAPVIFDGNESSPKEAKLLEVCKAELAVGRKILVYTTYTGTRDTTARLKNMLAAQGIKVSVLKASVEAQKREDWLADQLERGVEVVITNPELVKTGLDMLEFPTIVFMQTGYNTYTMRQAARRSWRIGQKQNVNVLFLGYENSAQQDCLELMAKKIAVSQSTSGDMPETGLDVLNQEADSIEIALAKKLVNA